MSSVGSSHVRPLYDAPYIRIVKPLLDWLLAIVFGALLLPVSFAVAGAVLLRLGRPVLYRQVRVGTGGKQFQILKFRTMTPDRRTHTAAALGKERRLSYEALDDTRHTQLGSWLRAWSLDELPQLWNVLKGDMSIVGPRPEVPAVVAAYSPWQHERHLLRPGMTGLWQVNARGVKPMHANVEIDVEYVRGVTFMLDCQILLRTIPTVLAAANVPPRRWPPAEYHNIESPPAQYLRQRRMWSCRSFHAYKQVNKAN